MYPRARELVTTWRVLEEREEGTTFVMRIEAKVETERLRMRLAGLTSTPAKSAPARAVACVAERGPSGVFARSPSETLLRKLLSARGIEVTPADGNCSPVSGETPDPATAVKLCKTTGATGAVVATIVTRSPGTVRGTDLPLYDARARLALVEPDGRVSAVAEASRDAFDGSAEAAAERAANAALEAALRDLERHIAARWPTTAAKGGGVLVRAHGLRSFADYQALVAALRLAPGAPALAVPRRFSPLGVELQVATAARASALAPLVTRAALGIGRFTAEVVSEVELVVALDSKAAPAPSIAPSSPPPPAGVP